MGHGRIGGIMIGKSLVPTVFMAAAAVCLLQLMGCATEGEMAGGTTATTVTSSEPAPRAISTAPVSGVGASASGAVEDSSSACLSRVPKDATAGQRMMAEQSCNRDAADRKSIQSVPGK